MEADLLTQPAFSPVAPEKVADLEARVAALEGDATEARVDALCALVQALAVEDNVRRLALAEEAGTLAQRLGYEAGYAFALGLQGHARYLLSDHLGALPLLAEARAREALLPGQVAARFRSTLASIYVSLGNYEEALQIALGELEQAQAAGDLDTAAWLLQGLSATSADLGDARLALDFGMRALDAFTHLAHPAGQSRAHSAIGTALRLAGRNEEARTHHEVSLRLARESGVRLSEARALHDLGLLAFDEGHYEEAFDLHGRALTLRRATANRQAESTSLIELGRTLRALARPDEAVAVLQEALALAEALQVKPRVYQTHLALADAYEAGGHAAEALHHLRRYQTVREEVMGMEAAARLETIQARYHAESARQEAEIARLRNVELREKNEQLEKLLEELRRTQTRLVQSEKLAGLGRVTAGIAHEIKNPLNFITNFATLNAEHAATLRAAAATRLAELPADFAEDLAEGLADVAENATRVLGHARRADGIVKNMLGHVRAIGTGSGERRPVALHALLDQSVEAVFGARTGDGAVAVARDYDPAVTDVVAEVSSLGRVFVNLLENARYAVHQEAATAGTDGYAPQVELRTRALAGLVQVRVVDNGPGVPAAHCTRLFEPFFTTKPPGEGTGLGLSLAYDIVTAGHGGSLAVHSREGEGATFVVTLPTDGLA